MIAALFEFPANIVTFQGIVACVLLLWASVIRFGRAEQPERAIPPGKQALAENGASLLRFGKHYHAVIEQYFLATRDEVTRGLHAPPGLRGRDRLEWLVRMSKQRKASVDIRKERCIEIAEKR